MNKHILPIAISLLLFSSSVISQRIQTEQINTNKFRQLNQEFSSPNMFRTASGAPGPAYYQQQADYKINIELDDLNKTPKAGILDTVLSLPITVPPNLAV